jgi:hypothetical protein
MLPRRYRMSPAAWRVWAATLTEGRVSPSMSAKNFWVSSN